MGDFNKDGYADVLIGAYGRGENGKEKSGVSYTIFGKATGFLDIDLSTLTFSQGFKILGAATNDWSGFSVSDAGDFNGDGYSDIIIGAYQSDPNSQDSAGSSYVIYGKGSDFFRCFFSKF